MLVSTRPMSVLIALGLFGISISATGLAADGSKLESKVAFAKMKSLVGEWKSEAAPGQPSQKVVYRMISNGSVVMETLFPDTDQEMVTMYLLDGDELRLTHYCAAGNQPKLKLDAKISTTEKLEFVFEGGTNFDPAKDIHMHAGRIFFRDKNHIQTEWDGYADGRKTGTNRFVLTRS